MINVLIKSDSHHQVDRKRIRAVVNDFLIKKKAKKDIELSVSIVGDRMMRKLNRKYRNEDDLTAVLAFPQFVKKHAHPFMPVPDGILRLGDIVISYPQALELAYEKNMLVDDVIDFLCIHGLKHLLGNEA